MDFLHRILNWIDHNRGVVTGLVLAGLLSVGFVGCTPRTDSVLVPGTKVTAAELDREVVVLDSQFSRRQAMLDNEAKLLMTDMVSSQAALTAAEDDLSAQYELRQNIMDLAGGLVTAGIEGTLSPATAIPTVIQLITLLGGLGLGYDNFRKGRVITELKTEAGVTS